ncbi:MAG: GldG family protein [Patescibacteria group bacterium]|nr:GldG family protein [Patescibacteria group bacterium]
MDNKKIKRVKKTDLGVTVLLLLGIIIVVNFFSYQVFFRWDLTENKVFSVSNATKNTVASLDDIVNIKAYFSANLPNQVLLIKQEVADILSEYKAYSNGNVKIDFIDPADDTDLQQKLAILGIPQLTFEVYEKDKMQLVNGYMGIAISFGSETEVIPAIKRDTSGLEYQLTTAIKKVTTDEIAVIGYLNSQGTRSLEEELKSVSQVLSELYTVQPVTLSEEEPVIQPNIDTLIIAGPKEVFNEVQLEALNFFVTRGGALLVLMDGVNIEAGLVASKNNTNLDEFLTKYGITINKDLVADTQSGMASFSQGFFTFSSNYPFWPKLTNNSFSQDNSAVSNLENVILPWASSIDIDNSKITEGFSSNLAFTTAKSWRMTDNFDIAPNGGGSTPQGEQKQYNLITYVNGSVPNAYGEERGEEKINARIIVVGDSDFMTDGFLRNSPDNITLMQNLVDVLSFDEDLINIRSKGVTSRPIKELSESAKASIRYLNIFGLTVAVIAFGMIRYYLRRKSRFVDDI